MDNRRIIHVVGFDYDGCLYKHDGRHSVVDRNARLLRAIIKQNEHAFAASFLFVSSNRQSFRVDSVNSHNVRMSRFANDGESSCFETFLRLASQLEGVTFCRMLLADAYAERPNGYSFARALLRSEDETAYHPDYLFDKDKVSLIYTQAHTAARLARSCDFVILDECENSDELFDEVFESNAAYVYIKDENKLCYVNRAESQLIELPIDDAEKLNNLVGSVNSLVEDQEHHFEHIREDGSCLKGVTLNSNQLDAIKRIAGHRHQLRDYPIVFDFYDDLHEIHSKLSSTFSSPENRELLPGNVMIRLNLYTADRPANISSPISVIRGAGEIDLQPKDTILKMAKLLLKKELFDDTDFEEASDGRLVFSDFMNDPKRANFFRARVLASSMVSCDMVDRHYAPLSLYNSSLEPEDVMLLQDSIRSLRRALQLPFTLYAERKQLELNILTNILHWSKSRSAESISAGIGYTRAQIRFSDIDVSRKTKNLLEDIQRKYDPRYQRQNVEQADVTETVQSPIMRR